MDARRIAEASDAADMLRAFIGRILEDCERAARRGGGAARRRMAEAGEMARSALGVPDLIDGMAAMCNAYAVQSAALRKSLAQVVREKNKQAAEHAAYREEKDAEVVDLKYNMALLRARSRVPAAAACSEGEGEGDLASVSREELVARVKDGERRLQYLDNADTPSSARSINNRYAARFGAVVGHIIEAAEEGRDPAAEGPAAVAAGRQRGGQPGHKGVSNNDKPVATFRAPPPTECAGCHSARLADGPRDCYKRMWDLVGNEDLAELEPVDDGAREMLRRGRIILKLGGGSGRGACIMLIMPRVLCTDCGAITRADAAISVDGTAMGSLCLTFVEECRPRMPDAAIVGFMGRQTGVCVGKTAVRSARFASTRARKPAADDAPGAIASDPWHLRDESEIKGSLGAEEGEKKKGEGGGPLTMDEILAAASPSRLQALVAVSPSGACVRVARSRARSVIVEMFVAFLDRPFGSDEYSGQTTGEGHIRQSDWTHLLRKARMAAALAFFALFNRGLIEYSELCEYVMAAQEFGAELLEEVVRGDPTIVMVEEVRAEKVRAEKVVVLPALPAPADASSDAAAAGEAAAKEARRKKAAKAGMPPLDAEKEEQCHNDIICFLILNSIHHNVRKIDTASEDTIALLRGKVEGVLELYGEKHPVKTSFTNALATLFMALLVPGMPFETTEVERIVRDIVMVYKRLHRQIQCQEGADHASIEMTFDAMCKKRGIPPAEALLRILRDPMWRPFKGRPGTGVSLPALTH